jgi:hypothetical protein
MNDESVVFGLSQVSGAGSSLPTAAPVSVPKGQISATPAPHSQ